jgi:GT2 family glycosyltransferase
MQRDVKLDVVVVGNGWVPEGLPDGVRGIALAENVGIPAGRNAGVAHVAGELLVFLDDDERLRDPDFLVRAHGHFARDRRLGMLQPRIEVLGGGDPPSRWTPRARVGDRRRSSAAFRVVEGAVVVRRDAFERARGWAEPFWYAHEGVELAWRVWDADLWVLYAADLVAEHPRTEVTRHADSYRYDGRNRVLLARRNLPVPFGLLYVTAWLGLHVVRHHRDPRAMRSYATGMWEGARTSPGERRPLRWRTIARMSRRGHPPVW